MLTDTAKGAVRHQRAQPVADLTSRRNRAAVTRVVRMPSRRRRSDKRDSGEQVLSLGGSLVRVEDGAGSCRLEYTTRLGQNTGGTWGI